MQLARRVWFAIKRNPVINAFVAAVVVQVAHDYLANEIDWTNILGYIATVCFGIVARMMVTPVKDPILGGEEIAHLKSIRGNVND